MNLNLIVFNIAYYLITFLLYQQTQQDPSNSLGVGFFALFFWLASGILLIVLCKKKIIKLKTLADKIGVFTATPVLTFIAIQLLISIKGNGGSSEWYFNKNNHRYKVITTNHRGSSNTKSIEYYKSSEPVSPDTAFYNIDKWVKDSVWLYFSKKGDTTKMLRYKNNQKVDE